MVTRHKARLSAEFTKSRIRLGYASSEALRATVDSGRLELNGESSSLERESKLRRHPRWVRINTLKSSLENQLRTTFKEFASVDKLDRVLSAQASESLYFLDQHIPNLVALPNGFDVANVEAYKSGELIIQDKASCFPAYLLDIESATGDIIDACAAPGNKTTQLAASCGNHKGSTPVRKVHAFEKDGKRSQTLLRMVQQAGANGLVNIHAQSDFLLAKPSEEQYQNVTAILLDPSCSGSGIVGREEPKLKLPEAVTNLVSQRAGGAKSKKRKRNQTDKNNEATSYGAGEVGGESYEKDDAINRRLESLSAFQLKVLQHAMCFPSATRIVYSTCSIHEEENECVVVRALGSAVAREGKWRIFPRSHQVPGLRKWDIRGDVEACANTLLGVADTSGLVGAVEIADACIRCGKDTDDGTIGFFTTGFYRAARSDKRSQDLANQEHDKEEEEEWNGCSDTE
jgi:25S rRNA (cytosine2278-C5)-methyltransferase